MAIIEVIALLSLVVSVLNLGYKIGKDLSKKNNRQSDQD